MMMLLPIKGQKRMGKVPKEVRGRAPFTTAIAKGRNIPQMMMAKMKQPLIIWK